MRRIDAALALALLVAGTLLAWAQLHWTIDRIVVENCQFGADAREILEGMSRGVPGSVDSAKHMLARIWFTIGLRVGALVGLDARTAYLAFAALLGGALPAAAFGLFRLTGLGRATALAGTAFLIASNGIAIQYATTETYLFTATMIVLGLIGLTLIERSRLTPWRRAIAAGIAAGVVASAHLPAGAILAVHMMLEARRGTGAAWLARLLAAAGIALAIGIAPYLAIHLTHPGLPSEAAGWTNPRNFVNPAVYAAYLPTFFLYSVVAPLSECACRYLPRDMLALAASPARLAAAIGYGAVLGGALLGLRRAGGQRWVAAGCALVLVAFFLFYLYFFPWEAMLPAGLFMVPLATILAIGLGAWRFGWVALLALAVLLFTVNNPRQWGPVRHFSVCCPKERWSPWPAPPSAWTPPDQL